MLKKYILLQRDASIFQHIPHTIDTKFAAFRNLSDEKKSSLADLMISQTELFYKSPDENVANFRAIFAYPPKDFRDILKNLSDFKELIKIIYK